MLSNNLQDSNLPLSQRRSVIASLGLNHTRKYGAKKLSEGEFNMAVQICRYAKKRKDYYNTIAHIDNVKKDNPDLSLDIILEANKIIVKEFDDFLTTVESVIDQAHQDISYKFKEEING